MLFQVVINTEWGAFGNNGCLDFIVSEYDKGVDQISKNPKQQMWVETWAHSAGRSHRSQGCDKVWVLRLSQPSLLWYYVFGGKQELFLEVIDVISDLKFGSN